jgi:DNA gyrase subunit A
MLADIDKETVDFRLNFDDTLQEPTVLPSKIPNLLVNGASGIAVGMATNMAPHNLTEVLDATMAYIENKEVPVEDLLQFVKAPDFPTGGIIYGYNGVREALLTGRGRVVMRARTNIETLDNGRERIIVTEIPYLTNKADMIRKTADLVNEKKLEGITDIRDESDRDGMRVVYDIHRDAQAAVVLNNLFKYTGLQSSFSVNNIALSAGRPVMLNLKDLIAQFVDHRHDVLIRKTRFDLNEAEKRAHILEGLLIALDHLDEVIALIRKSDTPEVAKTGLMESFGLTEIQSKAILDMRLQRLTGLERDKIREEYNELMKMIAHYKEILDSETLRMQILKDEMAEMRSKYGDDRRTEIVYAADEISMEDIIADDAVVITISHMGYIKRTPLNEYRIQAKGGKGLKGASTRDEDFVEYLFVATNHNYILLFTEKGRCYWLRAFEIPEGDRTGKGRAIQNIISMPADDKVKAFINVKNLTDEEYLNNNYIILCTKDGTIKKTSLEAYSRVRQSGIIAINIREEDQLLEARLTSGRSEILMALKSGRAIRFNESTVRPMGRNATGVRGVSLADDQDEVVGMVCVNDSQAETILVVSENGYGKRTDLDDYRVTNRGGKGVKTLNITDKTGNLVAIKSVFENDELMIINKSGICIRMPIRDIRVMGRATQGVRVIRLNEDDQIASVARIDQALAEVDDVTDPSAAEGDVHTSEDFGTDFDNNGGSESAQDEQGADETNS